MDLKRGIVSLFKVPKNYDAKTLVKFRLHLLRADAPDFPELISLVMLFYLEKKTLSIGDRAALEEIIEVLDIKSNNDDKLSKWKETLVNNITKQQSVIIAEWIERMKRKDRTLDPSRIDEALTYWRRRSQSAE